MKLLSETIKDMIGTKPIRDVNHTATMLLSTLRSCNRVIVDVRVTDGVEYIIYCPFQDSLKDLKLKFDEEILEKSVHEYYVTEELKMKLSLKSISLSVTIFLDDHQIDYYPEKDERLTQEQRDCLTRRQRDIVQDLLPMEILDILVSEDNLTQEECAEVRSSGILNNQNRCLLDILHRKSKKVFESFRKALVTTKQDHIAQLLINSRGITLMIQLEVAFDEEKSGMTENTKPADLEAALTEHLLIMSNSVKSIPKDAKPSDDNKDLRNLYTGLTSGGSEINHIRPGCVEYLMYCPTCKSFDDLMKKCESGELERLFNAYYVSDNLKAEFDLKSLYVKLQLSPTNLERKREQLISDDTKRRGPGIRSEVSPEDVVLTPPNIETSEEKESSSGKGKLPSDYQPQDSGMGSQDSGMGSLYSGSGSQYSGSGSLYSGSGSHYSDPGSAYSGIGLRKMLAKFEGGGLMSVEHRRSITIHLEELCNNMKGLEVMVSLLHNKVIDDIQFNIVTSQTTPYEQNCELLILIKKGSEKTYAVFIAALRKSNQGYLANMIEGSRRDELKLAKGATGGKS